MSCRTYYLLQSSEAVPNDTGLGALCGSIQFHGMSQVPEPIESTTCVSDAVDGTGLP